MTLNTSICKSKHKYISNYGEDKDSVYIMYLDKKKCMGGQCRKNYHAVFEIMAADRHLRVKFIKRMDIFL